MANMPDRCAATGCLFLDRQSARKASLLLQTGLACTLRCRARRVIALCVLAGLTVGLAGCQQMGLRTPNWDFLKLDPPGFRSQSPDDDDSDEDDDFDDELTTRIDVPMVGDYTTFSGLHRVVLEGVGLVVGLNGTGGDPPPSPYREVLLDDMSRRDVKDAKKILRSPSTALVVVRAYLSPLIRRGDRFDVEVRIPGESGATSLAGGRLYETILTETAIVPGRGQMKGHIVARAQGPILTALADPDNEEQSGALKRGSIPGGGVSLLDRDMALYVRTDFRTYRNITRLADRIGKRFYAYDRHGIREPLAEAQTDQRIVMKVHPRYQENYPRFLQVVRNIAFRESPVAQRVRMKRLEQQLLTPQTAEGASLQLEAIGEPAIPVLRTGLKSKELECRFHAALALAYLEESDGIDALKEAARDVPAFRVFAYAALSTIEDPDAHMALRDLMDVQQVDNGKDVDSAETRYGAFRALWMLDPRDPFIAGEKLNQDFWLHVLPTKGDSMVHMTQRKRPEIVLFGEHQEFHTPIAVRAGNHILVTSKPGSDGIVVSRFRPRGDDQRKVVSRRVADVIRTVAEFGATYPDVALMLVQADQQGNLPGRFEIDALPKAGRYFDRAGRRARLGRAAQTPNIFDRVNDDSDEDADDVGDAEDVESEPGIATVVDARSSQPSEADRSESDPAWWDPRGWIR